MAVAALSLEPGADLRFFLEFTGADGTQRREPLAACATERFERVLPVRSFRWAKGALNFPGSWWSSTTGEHVGFESWLERDHVMLMDFDLAVTGMASQPFWLSWQDGDGRAAGGVLGWPAAAGRRGRGRGPGRGAAGGLSPVVAARAEL